MGCLIDKYSLLIGIGLDVDLAYKFYSSTVYPIKYLRIINIKTSIIDDLSLEEYEQACGTSKLPEITSNYRVICSDSGFYLFKDITEDKDTHYGQVINNMYAVYMDDEIKNPNIFSIARVCCKANGNSIDILNIDYNSINSDIIIDRTVLTALKPHRGVSITGKLHIKPGVISVLSYGTVINKQYYIDGFAVNSGIYRLCDIDLIDLANIGDSFAIPSDSSRVALYNSSKSYCKLDNLIISRNVKEIIWGSFFCDLDNIILVKGFSLEALKSLIISYFSIQSLKRYLIGFSEFRKCIENCNDVASIRKAKMGRVSLDSLLKITEL